MVHERYSRSASLFLLAAVLTIVATAARRVDADAARSDSDLIQGTWNLNELHSGGNAFDSDQVEGTLSIDGTKATIRVKFQDQELYERSYQFKLYPFREPKAFDVIWDDGRVTRGIYHLEGDTWYRSHGEPDGARPSGFDNIAATGMISSLWNRPKVKPRPEPNP